MCSSPGENSQTRNGATAIASRTVMLGGRVKPAVVALGILAGIAVRPSTADTLNGALVEAYVNNPQLGAQRSATRATDENVAIQLGGYRPRLTATDSINEVYLDQLRASAPPAAPPAIRERRARIP